MDGKILAFVGSTRNEGSTHAAVKHVAELLAERGLETILWDHTDWPLEIADPQYHRDSTKTPEENARKLSVATGEADGFIFASPVYHNSFSGVLKNALDALSVSLFTNKPIGLMGHGGHRTTQAVDQLRIVSRALGATAIPSQVCTDKIDFETQDGKLVLVEEFILQRMERFADELVKYVEMMKHLRA